MSQSNLELIKSVYAAFAAGDVPTALAAMDPKIEWREAENFKYADGNPYIGPDAVLQGVFLRLATEWDGFSVNPEEFLDAGNSVVVLGRYRGVNKATGKSVTAQFAHVLRVTNGKLAAFQQYCDTAQLRDAIQTGQTATA